MKFKEYLNESIITIYHGDNFGTKKLLPELMNNGNNQEGIGIYYSTNISTAETYGKYIVKSDIDTKKFIDSRKDIGKYLKQKQIINLLTDMWKSDEDAMYYMITDWGIDIYEPEDIEPEHIEYLADNMKTDEVRNFQITLAEQFNVIDFVSSWNKHCKNIHGTFQEQNSEETWYCVINTKIKVYK